MIDIDKNKIIEIKNGSQLYGLVTPTSDLDYIGVFMPDEEYIFGLSRIEEMDLSNVKKLANNKNSPDSIDRKFYEFRHYVNLATGNNPNILELLFSQSNPDAIVFLNDMGQELLNNAHLFPYKAICRTFLGYSVSQKKRMLLKPENLHALREAIDILEKIISENDVNNHKLLAQYETEYPIFASQKDIVKIGDIMLNKTVSVKRAKENIKMRLDSASYRTATIDKYGFDLKFAHHNIRLLLEGLELLNTGRLQFPLKERELLYSIKTGGYTLEQVLKLSEELEKQLDDAENNTKLPSKPRFDEIQALTIRLVKQFLDSNLHNSNSDMREYCEQN